MKQANYIPLLLIAAALTVYTYTIRYRPLEKSVPCDLSLVPASVAGYTGTDGRLEEASLGILGADATLFRTYRKEGSLPIWLFLGYFGSQQERSQIHSPKHCYPGSGWNILREGVVDIDAP